MKLKQIDRFQLDIKALFRFNLNDVTVVYKIMRNFILLKVASLMNDHSETYQNTKHDVPIEHKKMDNQCHNFKNSSIS